MIVQAAAAVGALTGGTLGVVVAAAGEVAPEGTSVMAYVFGGGATVVLAGLVADVARRLMNGQLIARKTSEVENELGAGILAAAQREAKVMQIAEDATKGSVSIAADLELKVQRVAASLADTTRHTHEQVIAEITALTRLVHDLRDEVREDRRGRP